MSDKPATIGEQACKMTGSSRQIAARIDALVAAASRPPPGHVRLPSGEDVRVWCSQCGQYLWESGCGPTHAAMFAELQVLAAKDAKP